MAVTNFSPLLGLALPTTGDLSGTWGTTVNDSITSLLDSSIAATTTLSTDLDVTLSTTNGAANQARNAVLLCTGARTTLKTITAPAQSKAYIVINATTGGFGVKVVASGQVTGVTIVNGEKALIAYNGTDFVIVSSSVIALASEVSGVLPVANGGSGTATPALVAGSNVTITGTWPNQTIAAAAPGSGTVTAVSVATANGLAGTSSGGATPALTLSTSVTGVLKGNGTAISAATAGTDYLAPPSGTALLKANSGGALANASAGTDYVAPGTATTFTAKQTFSGTASVLAMVFNDAAEVVTVSATAATGTINYDVTTQSVLYYTTNASANWTLNVRASSGTSLNTALSDGQSVTIAFLVTQGATAYYQSGFQVDGSAVTPKWQGGTAPTSGNASGVDIYSITIIKTASATFTAFASQTRFA